MSSYARFGLRAKLAQNLNLIVPILIVTAVLALIVPMPSALLDVLLAANITLSVVILLTTVQVGNPLDFNVFPSLLLGTTLARLVLNVASTRLILANAAESGTEAAGRVVQSFGEFVAAGSPAVGLIMFLILITIQFVVITHGTTRIGEVAARFALDGMPGRQMAVDADLANGLMTKEEARTARTLIAQQADFYGAMDGASKFVRGDAIAGLIITAINVAGGLLIGILAEGMSVAEAMSVFTTLTIGDGLVAQIPALLISIAAGLLMTRSSIDSDLPSDMIGQVFRHPIALYVAAAFVTSLALTGLPTGPLLVLGAASAFIGWTLQTAPRPQAVPEQTPPPPPAAAEQKAQSNLRVEPLELELGVGLIRLADAESDGDLLPRIAGIRQRIAHELGFILPKVRVSDNLRLDPRQFRIKLRDVPVVSGEVYSDALLAVDVGAAADGVSGITTVEPATGRDALWIQPADREAAIAAGYEVHPPYVYLIQQLTEVVRGHAAELLARQQVHGLLNELRTLAPRLVDEVVSADLETSQIQQVLCNLLRERVSIRDLEAILEALGRGVERTRNPAVLTEYVRGSLARTISQQCRSADGTVHAIALSDELEQQLEECIQFDDAGLRIHAPATLRTSLIDGLRARLGRLTLARRPEVVVCRPEVRAGVRQMTRREFPRLHVLSHPEIAPENELVLHGLVELEPARADRQAVPADQRSRDIDFSREGVEAAADADDRHECRESVVSAAGGVL